MPKPKTSAPKKASLPKSRPSAGKATTRPPAGAAKSPRRLKLTPKQTRRVAKQAAQARPKLTAAPRLLERALRHLWRYRRLFGGIIVVHTVLTLLLVRSLSGGIDSQALIANLRQVLPGQGDVVLSLAFFSNLLGTMSATDSEGAAAYQLIITVITSLALIWALRQTFAKTVTNLSVKNAFYKSTASFVPFLLTFLLVCLQTVPFLVGVSLYGYIKRLQVAGAGELWLWLGLLALGTAWTVRMLSRSLWALYIVTLPNMTPRPALRSAKKMVCYRRLAIVRKLLFLPLALLMGAAAVTLPVILVWPALAVWLFMLLSMLALAIVHSYLYLLYRELLPEAS